jgi:poly(3-hydroxybutyrate) depolymerase
LARNLEENPVKQVLQRTILPFCLVVGAVTASVIVMIAPLNAHAQNAKSGAWARETLGTFSYWIYRPASAKKRSSLMLSLHGCAQSADDFKKYANWEPAAEKHRMTVVVPFVPNGGVYFGCWDYYGRDQTETNKSNGLIIALTESLLQRPDLNLNPKKVFISGLSSGSAQAMIAACLRPDLYRGVGLAAGPVLGSDVSDIYAAPRITGDEVAQLCLKLAGPRASAFADQVTSIIFDQRDSSVSPRHSALALEGMTLVYQHGLPSPAEPLRAETLELARLPGLNTNGKASLLVDSKARPRISYIMNSGLGHAWPAGAESPEAGQGSNRYINSRSVDYPDYLASLFN